MAVPAGFYRHVIPMLQMREKEELGALMQWAKSFQFRATSAINEARDSAYYITLYLLRREQFRHERALLLMGSVQLGHLKKRDT